MDGFEYDTGKLLLSKIWRDRNSQHTMKTYMIIKTKAMC